MIIDEEVLAVLTALVVVGSALSIALIIPRNPEPFLAIGLLNEKGYIGDYPTQIVAGEPVKLNIFLANHLGKVALLQVRVKLGSKGKIPTNSTPIDTPILKNITVILDKGKNITVPVSLRISQPGINQAIVFELWMLNTTSGTWIYTGRWNHLYVNVTPPGVKI